MAIPDQTDVLITGAGPAGAAAAMALSKKNIPCVIVDKETFPRDKVCGDALSGKTVNILKRLDANIVQEMLRHPGFLGSNGVIFTAPNGNSIRVPFKGKKKSETPAGFISKRFDFDNLLVQKLKDSNNIHVAENTEIRNYAIEPDGIVAESKSGYRIKSKIIIAADGASSYFARHVSNTLLESKHKCFGLRAYYKDIKDNDSENFIELIFLKEILPCYFWIFPMTNNLANVGIGIRSDLAAKKNINLKKIFDRIILEHPVINKRFKGATLIGKVKLASLPLGSKKRSLSGNRYLLCGDAAQLVDPFTGEGIGNALLSGTLAAEQVEKAFAENCFSEAFMKNYDQEVNRLLWKELSLSSRLSNLVMFPGLFNLLVNQANRNPAISETISCMFHDIDLRTRLKSPAFYWQLINPF